MRSSGRRVELVVVDEATLEDLVVAATTGAAPDDVTPPMGASDGWNRSGSAG
ncbi:MAG: hypothetical protein ACRDY7_09565 [Acidimicrobiia bacterium]